MRALSAALDHRRRGSPPEITWLPTPVIASTAAPVHFQAGSWGRTGCSWAGIKVLKDTTPACLPREMRRPLGRGCSLGAPSP